MIGFESHAGLGGAHTWVHLGGSQGVTLGSMPASAPFSLALFPCVPLHPSAKVFLP